MAGALTLEGTPAIFFLSDHLIQHASVVSLKALTALIELESLQRQLLQRSPTRPDAEFFQPRLGALVALSSGGILRPGSVSGLYLGMRVVYSFCALTHLISNEQRKKMKVILLSRQ